MMLSSGFSKNLNAYKQYSHVFLVTSNFLPLMCKNMLLFWKQHPTSGVLMDNCCAWLTTEKATLKRIHKGRERTCSDGNQTVLHHRYCLTDGECCGLYSPDLPTYRCFISPVAAVKRSSVRQTHPAPYQLPPDTHWGPLLLCAHLHLYF